MPHLNQLPASQISNLDFFAVRCREGSSLLRGRSRRALSAEEVTKTCEVLLAAALHRRCIFWLVDSRQSKAAQPAELHEWLQEDYFPRVRAQLGQPPCIALLVAPSIWQELPPLSAESPLGWPSWGARVGWFKEEDAAMVWLRQQGAHHRGRLPAAQPTPRSVWGEQLQFNF